jgi:hypothetical protein
MTSPYANSWTTAERNAFDYLLTVFTADAENTTAFLGEFPGAFADETQDYMWYFAANGGGAPDDVGAGVPYCGLNCSAIFEGIFKDREAAQYYGCAVKNLMPAASGAIAGISDIRLASEPSISRVVVKREADQAVAGDLRAWRLTVPIECVVVAVEEESPE